MEGKVINLITDILAFLLVIVIFYVISRYRKKSIENPTGNTLNAGEIKICETYCTTRDIKFKGFVIGDSALEGKLILTNQRLIYTTYDEKKSGISIMPSEIRNISIENKGVISNKVVLKLDYDEKKGGKPKNIVWKEVKKATKGGIFGKEYSSPSTLEEFGSKLAKWAEQNT